MYESSANSVTREINVGKIVGKSSYELALEAGTFKGTLEEYNTREARLYELFDSYELTKTELCDTIKRICESPKGSWFELNKINNLDNCNVPINTYINLSYIDINSLPIDMINSDGKVLFESVVTYMKDGTPCILKQTITEIINDDIYTYTRLQIANGNFSNTAWSRWQ